MKNFPQLPTGSRFTAGNMISGVKDGHDAFMKWDDFTKSSDTDARRILTGGSGIDGEADAYEASVTRVGNIIKTEVYIDIDGLVSIDADNDIIGGNDAANCWFVHITDAINGSIFKAKVNCMEAPTGGGPDIAIWQADSSTGVENAAISGLTNQAELLQSQGDSTPWLLGDEVNFATMPATAKYLYLVVDGTGTDAEFSAGTFLFEFWGVVS